MPTESKRTDIQLLSEVVSLQRSIVAEADARERFRAVLDLLLQLAHCGRGLMAAIRRQADGVPVPDVLVSRPASHSGAFWCESARLQRMASRLVDTYRIVLDEPNIDEDSGGPLVAIPVLAGEGRVVAMAVLAGSATGLSDAILRELLLVCDAVGAVVSASDRNERFRALVEHGFEGITILNRQGVVIYASPANRQFLGYDPRELEGVSGPGLIHPEDQPHAFSTLATARQAPGRVLPIDLRLKHRDEGWRWLECRVCNLLDHADVQGIVINWRDVTERHAIEAALRISEARYHAFVEHLADGVTLHDSEGRVVDVNRQTCENFGCTREELIGKSPVEFDPDVNESELQSHLARLDAGESLAFESRHRRKDGTTFPVELRIRPFEMDGKRFSLALARDITARKAAEAALHETKRRLEIILEGADVGLWDWNLISNQVVFSKEWKRQLGYAENELMDRYEDWRDRVHPDDLESALSKVQRAIARETPDYNAEFRMRHKNGSWRWILARGIVLEDAEGRSERMMGIHVDITDRKLVEESLRDSESRMRSVLEGLENVAVQAYEPDGTITFWNRGSEKFYGHRAEEALGQDIISLMHPKSQQETQREILNETLLADSQPDALELDVLRRDGTTMTVLANRILNSRPGRPPEFFCFDVDITARKNSEEQLAIRQTELLHASRLTTVGQMVAALSHEVAQPLNAVGNFAAATEKLLSAHPAGDSPVLMEYIRAILKQNQRCGAILQRLRDYSRRAAARRALSDLNLILRDSVELISNDLRRRDLRIRLELAEELPEVFVDRVQIQQVVVNLLANARDAMADCRGDRRQITVRSRAEEDSVVFAVVDHGPGIPPDVAGRMFEPFFTTKLNGMGIGLNICQTILREHEGQIEARSNSDGGATLEVRLPLP